METIHFTKETIRVFKRLCHKTGIDTGLNYRPDDLVSDINGKWLISLLEYLVKHAHNVPIVKLHKVHPDAIIPEYMHSDDAGADLYSIESASIFPGIQRPVKTGIAIELPPFTEGQIRSKSGLVLQQGLTVLNSPGTIDAGYRGEIHVILFNVNDSTIFIEKGDKIAQLVIARHLRAKFQTGQPLQNSQRGTQGFGSTGLVQNLSHALPTEQSGS